MSLTTQVAAAREVMTSSNRTRSSAMYLLNQDLARAHQAQRHFEAQQERRSHALVSHRRWQRRANKAEKAAQRAQLVLASL